MLHTPRKAWVPYSKKETAVLYSAPPWSLDLTKSKFTNEKELLATACGNSVVASPLAPFDSMRKPRARAQPAGSQLPPSRDSVECSSVDPEIHSLSPDPVCRPA